jgi:hypothetical protein
MPGARQKILLLPPMKGLNLFDNPFTMDPQFAEDLTNFMPPTNELKVRPGVVRLNRVYGSVRGMYSYAVGTTKSYGTNWYDQVITDGEYQSLLIKFFQNDGICNIYAFNPLSNTMEIVRQTEDTEYTNDYAIFKHSLMLCTGKTNLPMYIWSSRLGWKNMKWVTPDTKEITDLQNITFYNGMCMANASNTFDIFICDATKINPVDSSLWDNVWSWFQPKTLGNVELSLEGIAKKGGAILKMFTMSKSGIETVNSYFCVCTTMGEIIVWQGALDQQATPKFQLIGRFEIPVPLNKNCFCQMEGDTIVATNNGLYSLNRVIFGQQTQVTQALETRIQNVFDNYMFKDDAYAKFFGLYYHQKNRLLIFNTPARMPIPFNELKPGVIFKKDSYMNFQNFTGIFSSDQYQKSVEQIKAFISSYMLTNWVNYTVIWQFNDSYAQDITRMEGLFLTFNVTDASTTDKPYKVKIDMDFYINVYLEGWSKFSFLDHVMSFDCDDYTVLPPVVTNTNTLNWNQNMKKTASFSSTNETTQYFSYDYAGLFTNAENEGRSSQYEVTNIIPVTSFFASPREVISGFRILPGSEKVPSIRRVYFSTTAKDSLLPNLPDNVFDLWKAMGQDMNFADAWLVGDTSQNYWFRADPDNPDPMDYVNHLTSSMYGFTPWLQRAFSIMYPYVEYGIAEVEVSGANFYYALDTFLKTQSGKTHTVTTRLIMTVVSGTPQGANQRMEISCEYKYDGNRIPSTITTNNGLTYSNLAYYANMHTRKTGAGDKFDFVLEAFTTASTKQDIRFKTYEIADMTVFDFRDDPVVSIQTVGNWSVDSGGVDQRCLDSLNALLPNYTLDSTNWQNIAKTVGWMLVPWQFDVWVDKEPIAPEPPLPDLPTQRKSFREIIYPSQPTMAIEKEDYERIKRQRLAIGATPSPATAIQNANFDFTSLPLLSKSNIFCNYESTQYVFNSYYGTWAKWQDVNMIEGAAHLGDFYFIRPEDIPEGSVGTGFVYNSSVICKFDNNTFGDFDPDKSTGTIPISVSYQTPANNLGINQYKLINRLKILATQSTFWGTKANNLRTTIYSDFLENPTYYYQHSSVPGKERILTMMAVTNNHIKAVIDEHRERGLNLKDFDLNLLKYHEKKAFWKLYAAESNLIRQADISLLCRSLNRLGLKMEMDIEEANIVIYGYEIYLQIMQKV